MSSSSSSSSSAEPQQQEAQARDAQPAQEKAAEAEQPVIVSNARKLTEKEKKVMEKLVKKFDTNGNGQLEYNEFYTLMKRLEKTNLDQDDEDPKLGEEEGSLSPEQANLLFKGMDIDNSGHLNAEELGEAFIALFEDDIIALTKIAYRAADKDRSRSVTVKELSNAAKIGKKPLDAKQFDEKCKEVFGDKVKELTYAQFYQLMTGDDSLPAETDPYDGKIPLPEKKSKCCELI